MARVLFTGFEPFDGRIRNASGDFVEYVRQQVTSFVQHDLQTRILPVSFGRIDQALTDILAQTWDAVYCVGEAKTPWVRLERWAHNEDGAESADNDGVLRQGTQIIKGGDAHLPASLSLEPTLALLRAANIPTQLSDDAGRFLCNHVFYRVLAHGVPAEFVHVPVDMPTVWHPVLLKALLAGI